ncbi:unnamed protein product [Rotaria socialis]|uniref:Uncharacterized protein n=1 Tax=Rotaria socialis TaxID=392032 RepID=A0A820VXP0_9BILA|nr:unnamed protein product [Rotaria socialis]CAF4506381.1 unnamed protein product [Rotaria socialis]
MIGSIDNTSLVFEADRQQLLYFRLPGQSTSSNSSLAFKFSSGTDTNNIDGSLIIGLAICFGSPVDCDSVIIVPMFNPTGSNYPTPSVITLPILADGSIIIRINIFSPGFMCPMSNGTEINACILLTYRAYSVVNNNQISLPILLKPKRPVGTLVHYYQVYVRHHV